jgi:ribonuclease HI
MAASHTARPGWLSFFKTVPDAFQYFGPKDINVLILDVRVSSTDTPTSPPARLREPVNEPDGEIVHEPLNEPVQEALNGLLTGLKLHGLVGEGCELGDGDLRTWAMQGVLVVDRALLASSEESILQLAEPELPCIIINDGAAPTSEVSAVITDGDAPISEVSIILSKKLDMVGAITHHLHISKGAPSGPDVFAAVNDQLVSRGRRPVEWDPLGFTMAFTDGSCQRNGAPDADASYAAYIESGPLKGVNVCGRVEGHSYAMIDATDPCRGFAAIRDTDTPPTNNRGEYLAWCWLLLLLLRSGVRGRVEVVSDCKLFIQTMEDWLPARRRKGTAQQLKNFDLVEIGETLLAALRAQCDGVTLTHVNSHRKQPPATAPRRVRAVWAGNDRVDRMASQVLKGADSFTLDAPRPLRFHLHGRY